MLEDPVSLKELKETIFGLGGEKVLGPNDFQAFSYQFFWDLLSGELLAVVEESRTRGFILKEFNCTLVVLIPKKDKPVGFEELCPISLCNTIYKIISNVVANMLKLISCEQSGFTPGRNIIDGIIVAHEEIHMAMKSRQRRMMLKLDIQKAYDRVDRSFLLVVLAKFGFSKCWIKWIYSMVMQFNASILVNGSPQASIQEAAVMKQVLDRFSWATGQEINWQKSKIFFFHTEAGSQRAIARLFGIRIGQLPGKFLGTLLFAGAGMIEIWKGLLDGCKAKMEGWKSKWLTLDQDKIPLMAWDRVYKPKGGGGAGLRYWKLNNEAMGVNLVWQMYSKPKQRWNSWDGCPSLDIRAPQRIIQKTIQHWGNKVSDILVQDSLELGQQMTWKDPCDLDLEEVDQRLMRNILASKEVMSSREEGEILWCGAKSGIYSIKMGYALLEAEGKKVDWEAKFFWNNTCLPKASAFSWLAGTNRVLTGDRLKRMGFAGPFHCMLCKMEEEDVDHILLKYYFSQEAWCFGLQRLSWKGSLAGKLCDWLDSWPTLHNSSTFAAIWKVMPSTIMWEVWKEQNRRLFEDKSEPMECFLIKLERVISELVSNATSQVKMAKTPFTQFDVGILVRWPLIKFRPTNGILRANPPKKGKKSQEWVPLDKD
ncbi:uncharacterized protein LOC131875913 [Cryptomeria japonica]|uniref:uncharacterized protein LOC131875913 n=1 Tax=Cryptomeria japonica TaxID=3369 RepID=UPI0027DA2EDF|nr:uncharacterized protein LOC131875913 [Cryptomeria japonica]